MVVFPNWSIWSYFFYLVQLKSILKYLYLLDFFPHSDLARRRIADMVHVSQYPLNTPIAKGRYK